MIIMLYKLIMLMIIIRLIIIIIIIALLGTASKFEKNMTVV